MPVAVVTGASSGIGAATARALAAAGFDVVVAARRTDRVESLAAEIGGRAVTLDVTDRQAVDRFAAGLDRVDVLVANAGAAYGADPVGSADPDDWRRMLEVNVLGTLNVVQALLPILLSTAAARRQDDPASSDPPNATVVIVSSTAGFGAYEGGGGYVAAKHGTHALAATLRLELFDQPVRVVEIAPGMVRTDEFALTRFDGDTDRAAAVYRGVANPLTADDVAAAITWSVTQPPHVNVDLLVLRPRAQAAQHKVDRSG